MSTASHDTDFFGWTRQQAQLLRTERIEQLDVSNLIDEIEDMGQSQIRELESRLGVLLAHLLEWRYQPERRGVRWFGLPVASIVQTDVRVSPAQSRPRSAAGFPRVAGR